MADSSGKGRRLFESIGQERDPQKQRELCAEARKLIQDELLQLGSSKTESLERETLERALRQLWTIENQLDSPDGPN
jgi:hypothetical protein